MARIGKVSLAVAVLVAGLALWFWKTRIAPATTATTNCQAFVKERLKAPATAKFSNEVRREMEGGFYIVTGSVDSQNSFGATLRSKYNCMVTKDGALRNLDLE